VPNLVGRTLSHFEIIEEISRGGMGVVYRARDTRLHRDVALKVLPPALLADPDRRERFVQEARAASALEHPHIAVIHAIDEVDGISFIAMELIRGEKLSDVVARGPLPPSRALDLAVEVAEGLARAHDRRVVHRDLKPANVMLTEEGHAKIIDFGLAKLIDALSGDSDDVTVVKLETNPGAILGTVSYMSPEQARGAKVDHRSDVFSFGIVLYEMLTGRPPFRGNTGVDTMHAILHDPAPPLPPLVGPVAEDLQRIVDKCLAKDPGERYQGMRDVVVDLRSVRRRLESTSHASADGGAPQKATAHDRLARSPRWMYGTVALVVVALAGFILMRGRWTATPDGAGPSGTGKPSLAILYFENNTGSPQLDWLRSGLTDMLVTDLSQSPDVEVLPTDRLVQILGDLKRQDDRVFSSDTVEAVAKRAGVNTVVLGSYVKAGDTIRINVRLQEAGTGRILTAERVDAPTEASLLATIDDLTRRIKSRFAISGIGPRARAGSPGSGDGAPPLSMDRDLKDVTTSSIDAYRSYVTGVDSHNRGRDAEAIPLLEQAIASDPSFAMAFVKLAIVESNVGHVLKSGEYSRRAMELVDRLSARERYYIEGSYYSNRADTLDKAIDSYKKAVDLYPDHASARHNLATMYSGLGREEDAIPLYEELRRRGTAFPATYTNLAGIYRTLGAFDKAQDVLQDYVRAQPAAASPYTGLGDLFAAWGKWDEALAWYDRALAIDPKYAPPLLNKRTVYVVTERWPDLEVIDRTLIASHDPALKLAGLVSRAREYLYRGRATDALQAYETAADVGGPHGSSQSANVRLSIAHVLMTTGQHAAALASAERAVKDAAGVGPPSVLGVELVARLRARLRHDGDAARANEEFARRMRALPSEPLRQTLAHQHAAGLALDRHETQTAIDELKQAEALTRVGLSNSRLFFDLATAYLEAGNDAEAVTRFTRIVDSGTLRAGDPLEYVRSLYFLAQIHERRGDRAKAAEYYGKFLKYWRDGEIDRDRVQDARLKVTS
jgi:eukaryotic-like serine/threonine-protein kinase